MRPIPEDSVNHNAPSGPTVMALAKLPPGTLYIENSPDVVMRPMMASLSALIAVNHSAPSGPAVMLNGTISDHGKGYSAMAPDVAIRPMVFWLSCCVNHSAPSGPLAIDHASLLLGRA